MLWASVLGEEHLIFCCTGPTDPNFWQIKIIMILISHINIFLFLKQKFSSFGVVESRSEDTWSFSEAQFSLPWWSIFLFLYVPYPKLRIIIILATDRPKIILPTAHTTEKVGVLCFNWPSFWYFKWSSS